MADFKPYVVIQEFVLNIDNGQREVKTKYGDLVEFDGLNVRCKDIEGQARSFSRIARDGEWVKPIASDKVNLLKQRLASKEGKEVIDGNTGPSKSRNETGGKIVENSDIGSTRVASQKNPNKDLQDLVNKYEDQSFPDSHDDPNKRNVKDTKIEQNVPERSKVINYDDDIVAEISKEASTDAKNKNTAGVELEDLVESKPSVVSDEERVVKATNYSKKEASDRGRKKLVVESESEGTVVKRTSIPAINKDEVTEKTRTNEDSLQVSHEEVVVSETSYEKDKPTDIGSSTKAGVVANKKSTSKKAAPVELGDQGAVVVGKVSAVEDSDIVDGITISTTVGVNEESFGEVTFSSGGDGIENTEATFSGTGLPVADLSGTEDPGTSNKSSSSIDDGDIDISDLLD